MERKEEKDLGSVREVIHSNSNRQRSMTHGDPGDEGDPEDTPEDGGLDVADCEDNHDDAAADAEPEGGVLKDLSEASV